MSDTWHARAELFTLPRPMIAPCARGLHDTAESGIRTSKRTIGGKAYVYYVCRVCANAATARCMRNKRERQRRNDASNGLHTTLPQYTDD
jgi:hypothetical protein